MNLLCCEFLVFDAGVNKSYFVLVFAIRTLLARMTIVSFATLVTPSFRTSA